jgi:NO-binding membrane sensor protein with MHYT domain
VHVIEALDWLGELVLRRPWHAVGIVIALNVIVIALWIALEKWRERNAQRRDSRHDNEHAENSH